MAKGKKNEKGASQLSIDEQVKRAIVPVEEQPYSIPENWLWTRIGILSTIYTGNSINEKTKQDKYIGNKSGLVYIATKDIAFDGSVNYNTNVVINDYVKYKIAPPNTALLCIEGGSAGRKVGYVNQQVCFVNKLCAFVSEKIDSRFIYYYILSSVFIELFNSKKHGLIGGVSVSEIKEIVFPLPPLAEQTRIVAVLDRLFSQLDAAKAKAQAVINSFEDRKASILHRAFTGELTRKWREENGVGMESWKERPLGSFSFVTKLAGFEYTQYIAPNLCEYGIPLFKGKNVQRGKLVLEFESCIPEKISDELPRSQLKRKCLLAPYVGTIGNIAIFDGSFKAHLGSNVGKIEINTDSFEEYVWYYLRSDLGYKELTKQKKATAQESISIQAIREVIVPLPMITEQKKIVSILNGLMLNEQQIKKIAECIVSQIDTIKKSLLSRAFRGELGTNDPSDESARELLKRVLQGEMTNTKTE